MRKISSSVLLALAGLAALPGVGQAASVSVSGTAGPADSAAYQGLQVLEAPFASGAPLQVVQGSASATAQAWADPAAGMFKAITRAVSDGSTAEARAQLAFSDRLSFHAGGAATVTLQFTFSWDTRVTGLGFVANPALHFAEQAQYALSQQALSLAYLQANPEYLASQPCVADGDLACPGPEVLAVQQVAHEASTVLRAVPGTSTMLASGGSEGLAPAGNGQLTGTRSFSFTLPTDTWVELSYSALTVAGCAHVQACDVTADASHSYYLGLSVQPGVLVSSEQGYAYASAAPVPEPATAMLALLGLGGLAWRRRLPAA